MDFGRKLSRLKNPHSLGSGSERARTLEELRDRMAQILARPAPLPRKPADPAQSDLPFSREESPFGWVCRSRKRLPKSHHVGRVPVQAAQGAEAGMLGLLALDPSLSSADPGRALYLDTETTGLSGGAGVIPFLVGMAWFEPDGSLCLEQLLLKSPGEEPALLEHLRQRIEGAGMLVTYNGKSFDVPLLCGRCVMNRLADLPARPHLDLLHVGRRLHKARLGACRLKTLEREVLGFERSGDIEGADVAASYGHFLRTGDSQALSAVVEHNAWDVVSMAALVGLYGEPMSSLAAGDLVSLATTLKRAKALDKAHEAAERAVVAGVGAAALWTRGLIEKARGERARALSDFEQLLGELDDPRLRLELSKLYEHYEKRPELALSLVEQGTGESEQAQLRRRERLLAKSRRSRD